MNNARKTEHKRPNFIVTKYRDKKPGLQRPSKTKEEANTTKHGGLQAPEIKVEDASPRHGSPLRYKIASSPMVPAGPSGIALTVKEVTFDVPTPAPSPVVSPKLIKKPKPGRQIYVKACKKFHLTPIKSIIEGLTSKQLACKYILLREKDAEAIAVALVDNPVVQEVLFNNNQLCSIGAEILSEAVLHSDYITHVKITENQLGSEGARALCHAVSHNPTIESLDLSGNSFTENDAIYFKSLLEVSEYLTKLNLSHNQFMEEGAIMISKGLAKNRHLQELDLSWNHIRMKGAEAIGAALEVNECLEKLNLSWNGLHRQGARALAQGLEVNRTLKDLDVQCNRMSEECLAELLKGLTDNNTLEILKLGQNHLTSAGAYKVLEHFGALESSGIKVLDFGNQPVHDKFETRLAEILQERDLKVIYGMVWHEDRKIISADDVSDDMSFLLNSNPLTVIMECMRLQNFRLSDMFQSLDTDNNSKICIDELVNGLLKINVPLRRDILLQFLRKLDQNRDGQLDYREMREAQRSHKKQIKTYQDKNIDIKETEIGRVSKHIRNIMRKRYLKNVSSIEEYSSRETTPTPGLSTSSEPSTSQFSPRDQSLKLSLPGLTPRPKSRTSSPGRILDNISPFSCGRLSVTSSLSSEYFRPSPEFPTVNLSQSSPLPPIEI